MQNRDSYDEKGINLEAIEEWVEEEKRFEGEGKKIDRM